MKCQKIISSSVWLLAAMLLLNVSCAKQEAAVSDDTLNPSGSPEVPVDPSGRKVYCTISAGAPTKTTIASDGKVVWAEDDRIGAFADDGKVYEFELVAGAGGENATFNCYDPAIEGKSLVGYAVYPYTAGLTYDGATGKVQIAVPATQHYSCSSAPMIAPLSETATGGYHYYFRNISGVFEFTYHNVPPSARKVKFTATTDISGVFTLNSVHDNLTTDKTAASSGAATKQIVVDIPVARPDGSVTVQIPAPVGSYSGFAIVLCDADGNEIAGTRKAPASGSITAKLNTLSPIKAITLPEGLKVLWAWDNGGSLAQFDSNVPAIDGAGNVYVMPNSANLYKIDRNGNKVWSFALSGMGGTNQGSPSLEADGSVVYAAGGSTTGVLYAVNADGSQKWQFTAWPSMMSSHLFNQAMVAVSEGSNIYLSCNKGTGNDDGTVLSIAKSGGSRVGYLGYNAGSDFLGNASGPIAVSASGTVGYQSYRGIYTMTQSQMDTPPNTHATYGKYFNFGYRDTYGYWSAVPYSGTGSVSQGVICGKKGPVSGKDVMISCYQRGHAMLVTCNDAERVKGLDQYMDTVTLRTPGDAGRYYYWRFTFGSNQDPASYGDWDPAVQDRGGIVLGHEDLTVLLPLKNGGESSRQWRPAGVTAVFVGRDASQETHMDFANASTSIVSNLDAMRDWRFYIRPSLTYTPAHSVEPNPEVKGAPAVDNNRWVHIASHDCYHIIAPPASGNGYTANISSKAREFWTDLLNASGLLGYEVTSADVISSVKIGDDGRMYVNVNVNGSKGVTVCMSYPGVTGPDPTSSWPQKGADPRNSCCQVHDASSWTDNTITWD